MPSLVELPISALGNSQAAAWIIGGLTHCPSVSVLNRNVEIMPRWRSSANARGASGCADAVSDFSHVRCGVRWQWPKQIFLASPAGQPREP